MQGFILLLAVCATAVSPRSVHQRDTAEAGSGESWLEEIDDFTEELESALENLIDGASGAMSSGAVIGSGTVPSATVSAVSGMGSGLGDISGDAIPPFLGIDPIGSGMPSGIPPADASGDSLLPFLASSGMPSGIPSGDIPPPLLAIDPVGSGMPSGLPSVPEASGDAPVPFIVIDPTGSGLPSGDASGEVPLPSAVIGSGIASGDLPASAAVPPPLLAAEGGIPSGEIPGIGASGDDLSGVAPLASPTELLVLLPSIELQLSDQILDSYENQLNSISAAELSYNEPWMKKKQRRQARIEARMAARKAKRVAARRNARTLTEKKMQNH
jgi:hypothetical protein